jgi:uncharacterized protein DUF1937
VENNTLKLIYLASPYLYRAPKEENCTDEEWASHCTVMQNHRYEQAIDATAYLMNKGLAVYSPIVATHPVAVKHKLPLGSEYWMQFDELTLVKCDEIVVLMIDGWKESPGVQREIEIMQQLHKDITYLDPEDIK